MKRLSDNFLTMLLPLTVVAATAFGLVAAVAFRMEATTAAFVFMALSIVGWIGLVVEFFLLYDMTGVRSTSWHHSLPCFSCCPAS